MPFDATPPAEPGATTRWIDEVFRRMLKRLAASGIDLMGDSETVQAIDRMMRAHDLGWDVKPSLSLALLRMLFVQMTETPDGEHEFCGHEIGRLALATAAAYALGWKEAQALGAADSPPIEKDTSPDADLLSPRHRTQPDHVPLVQICEDPDK